MTTLTLAEELALLALDDATGAPLPATAGRLVPALGAAVLAELGLRGRLVQRGTELVVARSGPTGEPLLDDVLDELARRAGPLDAHVWAGVCGGLAGERVLDALVARGILAREPGRVLFVIPVTRRPARDPAPERALRERLAAVARAPAAPEGPDRARSVALLLLLGRAGALEAVFPDADARDRAAARARAWASEPWFARDVGLAPQILADSDGSSIFWLVMLAAAHP